MFNRRCNYKNLEELIKENKEGLLKDKKSLELIRRYIKKCHHFSNKVLSR
ncbi:FbpB family small basic protein [Niallia circulans]|nr:FbpB family small basic protein [Niallia circulans]